MLHNLLVISFIACRFKFDLLQPKTALCQSRYFCMKRTTNFLDDCYGLLRVGGRGRGGGGGRGGVRLAGNVMGLNDALETGMSTDFVSFGEHCDAASDCSETSNDSIVRRKVGAA